MNSEVQRVEDLSDFYSSNDGKISRKLISHYVYEIVKDHIWGRVLLMGLGDGYLAEKLSFLEDLTIVEGSNSIIASQLNPDYGYEVVTSLFEDYKPEKRFDTIIGTYVLEHVEDPIAILKLTRNWLNLNGLAIFIVPNADSLHRRVGIELGILKDRKDLSELDKKIGHRRVYCISEFLNDLEKSGYYILKLQGFLLKILSNEQMAMWDRELLNALFKVSLSLKPQFCSSLAAFCKFEDPNLMWSDEKYARDMEK